MQSHFVLTLTGPDRIGIVDEVTALLLGRGGNVQASRMARLGGEFAVLMLVSMPAEQFAGLEDALEALTTKGHKVTTTPARHASAPARAGWLAYRIEVRGADHEGIIHEVAHYLSEHGISIESVESETVAAPVSGSPLFVMTASVIAPPALAEKGWQAGLQEVGGRMNVDIDVSPTTGRPPA